MPTIWHADTHKGKGRQRGSGHEPRCQSLDQTQQRKPIQYPPQLPNPTIKTKKGIWGHSIPWSIHLILAHRPPRPKPRRIAYKPRKPFQLPNHTGSLESARMGCACAVGAIFEPFAGEMGARRGTVRLASRATGVFGE